MCINPNSKAAESGIRATRPSGLRRRGGFTLIEIVMGLTILAMITGTLFAIIRGSIKAATDIERLQRENDSINRLVELCRQTFQTMPSTTTLTLEIIEETDPVIQELTISGSPHCFGFGVSPISYQDTILGLRSDPNQTTSIETELPIYNFSLSREDLIPQTDENEMAIRQNADSIAAPDEEGRYWMPLLSSVNSLTWRFYKQSEDVWYEEWDQTQWPDLIEMNLTMDGRSVPIRAVFSVPVLSLRQGSQRNQSPTTPSTTTTTSGASPPASTPTSGGGAAPSTSSAPR